MGFMKKATPAVDPAPSIVLPVQENVAIPGVPAASVQVEQPAASLSPVVVGTQFLQLISKAADGTKIEALQVGQRGVIVVMGFTSVFVPGADIVDRGNGKQIV